MTTREITIDLKTILDSGWAYGAVSFEMITDVATSGASIYPQSLQKIKMDVDGVGSVDLAVPDTGAWVYEVRLPSTQESQIVVEDGAAVSLAELLETGLTPVPPSGDAYWVRLDGTNTPMTGELLLPGDPVSDAGAATKQSVDGKADKDTGAVVGNLAEFDAGGNPVDSGSAAGDYLLLAGGAVTGTITITVPTATASGLIIQTTDDGNTESPFRFINAAGQNRASLDLDTSGNPNFRLYDNAGVEYVRLRGDNDSFIHNTTIKKNGAVETSPDFNRTGLMVQQAGSPTANAIQVKTSGGIVTFAVGKTGNIESVVMKSGATQAAAGAVVGELWKTSGHATLPDNVVLHGV